VSAADCSQQRFETRKPPKPVRAQPIKQQEKDSNIHRDRLPTQAMRRSLVVVLCYVASHVHGYGSAVPLARFAPVRWRRVAHHHPHDGCIQRIAGSDMRLESEEAALEAREDEEIVNIAGPALLNTLLDPLLSVIDTFWVSRLGVLALGAVAASSELFTMTIACSLALRESAASTLARLFACGRYNAGATFARRTLQLSLCLGLAIGFVLGGPGAPFACGLMGAPVGSPLHADAIAYVRARAVALPCALAISATEGVFRGMGDTRTPLRAAAVAALLNFVLDPMLMVWPFHFGVGGAALATAIAQIVACVLLLRSLAPRLRHASAGADPSDPQDRAAPTPTPPQPPANEGDEDAERENELCSSVDGPPAAARSALGGLLGTSGATLLRTTSVIGCWVYIASAISRILGPSAIAAHGVVLKLWLLLVLAAEAPAVAGQVLCARAISTGDLPRARAILLRLLKRTALLGVLTAAALVAVAGPAAGFLLAGDPTIAASARRVFCWAALCTPLIAPNALCEAVLLGAGRSYKYLALTTLTNALAICALATAALNIRPMLSSAWICIFAFFILRFSCSAGRLFRSDSSGFGRWAGSEASGFPT
jgi:Na+-driven multidrug efflux pump